MGERVILGVPAAPSAFSTVRMVAGGLGARLDFSLDDLEDLYLATGELLRAAIDHEDERRIELVLESNERELRITLGPFTSPELRTHVEAAENGEWCVDLCTVLQGTMNEVRIVQGPDSYRIVLVKRTGEPL
jgi:hypothetical protein